MSDFYQTGVVAYLHRLGRANRHRIESELEVFGKQRPIALVLPALYTEFESGALHAIIEELAGAKYLRQIVLTLGGADVDQFCRAKDCLAKLPQQVRIIWDDGPQVSVLFQMLENHDLHIGSPGKGRACWIAYGYVLASEQSDIIALHDCDIVSYDRDLLALGLSHCKPDHRLRVLQGLLRCVTDRMHGRVTRLLMTLHSSVP